MTPTVGATAWKVYLNTRVGFEIHYPDRYPHAMLPSGVEPTQLADGSEDNAHIIFGPTMDDTISLQVFPFAGSLDELIQAQDRKPGVSGDVPTEKVKELQVDGSAARWFLTTVPPGAEPIRQEVYWLARGHGFVLQADPGHDRQEIEAALATFVNLADRPATITGAPEGVIRDESGTESAAWSTYENQERALRFKYPAEWTVQEFIYDLDERPARGAESLHLSFLDPAVRGVLGVSIYENQWASPEAFLAEINAGAPTAEQARFPFAKVTQTTTINEQRFVFFEWNNLMSGPVYSAAVANGPWLYIFHALPDQASGEVAQQRIETLTVILGSLRFGESSLAPGAGLLDDASLTDVLPGPQ